MELRLRIAGRVAGDGAVADGFRAPSRTRFGMICRNLDYHKGQRLFTCVRRGVRMGAYISSAIHISKGFKVNREKSVVTCLHWRDYNLCLVDYATGL
jgi:hypothetical protein